jgi:hypothetical protein
MQDIIADIAKTALIVDVDTSIMVGADGIPVDLLNTQQLIKWLRNKYQGKKIAIKDDGSTVLFTRKGLEDSAKRRGIRQRQIYSVLDILLEQAIYDGYELGDHRHPYVLKQKIYYAAVRIDDKVYAVKFKIDVFKVTGNVSYKDHRISIKIASTQDVDAIPKLSPYEGNTNGRTFRNESVLMPLLKEAFL